MLHETPDSPLFQFLHRGIASSYCPSYGYDISTIQSTFTIGFTNLSSKYKEMLEIESELNSMLHGLSQDGFDKNLIEGALHHLESEGKKQKKDFGITLLHDIIPLLTNNIDLSIIFDINQQLLTIKNQKDLFPTLIKRYFLSNQDGVRVLMSPYKYFIDDILDSE